jgi:hypothetical protein
MEYGDTRQIQRAKLLFQACCRVVVVLVATAVHPMFARHLGLIITVVSA